MDRTSSPGDERGPVGFEFGSNAARFLARERQKDELRRERDHLVLDLAANIGEAALAQRLGVSDDVLARMLAGARARLDARTRQSGEPHARRLSRNPQRWAEADTHFAALGLSASGGRERS